MEMQFPFFIGNIRILISTRIDRRWKKIYLLFGENHRERLLKKNINVDKSKNDNKKSILMIIKIKNNRVKFSDKFKYS